MAEGGKTLHNFWNNSLPSLSCWACVNSIVVCVCQAGGLKNLNVYFPNHIRLYCTRVILLICYGPREHDLILAK